MHKIALPQAAIDRVLKRRKSLHVFNDIDPARTAHVVVDLQNGFMAEGQPAEVPAAREIVPNVNRISAALRLRGRARHLHPEHHRCGRERGMVQLVYLHVR